MIASQTNQSPERELGHASVLVARRSVRRSAALFKAMGDDGLLREQFVTDPARIMSEYVHGAHSVVDDADAANHLIYALCSNAVTRNWMASARAEKEGLDLFARGLAEAVARSGDPIVALALIRAGASAKAGLADRLSVVQTIVASLNSRVSMGTEMSSPGTEMSQGRVFAGTEMSPGHGTEMSPGHGTEMSPGQVFAGTEMSSPGTEMSPGQGTEMSPGQVFAGTEMSSPGTEISPGPGTEVSPVGGFGGLSVVFQSLVQYAIDLRRMGALLSSGFELHR